MKQLYMKVQNNPSVIYGYKGARYFCDREMETLKIIKGLNNERNIALIAPRRIGKTGLIHHVFSQIQEQHPEICCKYIDILASMKSKVVLFIPQYGGISVLWAFKKPSYACL